MLCNSCTGSQDCLPNLSHTEGPISNSRPGSPSNHQGFTFLFFKPQYLPKVQLQRPPLPRKTQVNPTVRQGLLPSRSTGARKSRRNKARPCRTKASRNLPNNTPKLIRKSLADRHHLAEPRKPAPNSQFLPVDAEKWFGTFPHNLVIKSLRYLMSSVVCPICKIANTR